MTISYQWLRDYLPEALPVEELGNILTSIGLEVEAIEASEAVKGSLEGLVIGEVLHCEPHPNADKLKITQVRTGAGEPLNIVCGAPNVAAGQKVVVAVVGTTVHPTEGEPFLIKKAKIRGTESEGMICAGDEIGLNNDHSGIMILPEDAVVGTPAKVYFNIPEPDFAIHIGLTPNRSDAMSHIGVARDVCAYLAHHRGGSYEVRTPEITLPAQPTGSPVQVRVEAPDACPRYAGICLSGVRVGPSPEWLQQRLRTIGLRSINNVVDITNYVLHEYGQPLHAFDAAKIGGNMVRVGFLPEGSPFTTLDEKERKLRSEDLMILDEKEGMCIAGVFGGAHSGVTDQTTTIFLESAYFNPVFVRRTSLHHGLRTDAATHFEKGVDINNVVPALKRAAALMVELCGAQVASELIDAYPKAFEPVRVSVSYEYINRLTGKQYDSKAVKSILLALNFRIESEENGVLTLLVPSNKTDVLQPADIVEEVLRIDGLDQITIPERLNITLMGRDAGDWSLREKLSNQLCGMGFQEIVTNSIVNSKYYPDREDLVRMLNSLSSELDVMRPQLLESGLEVIHYNNNRRNQDLSLFEFGNTYRKGGEQEYIQEAHLGLWISGQVRPAQWNGKQKGADIFYLKGMVSNLLQLSGIGNVVLGYEDERTVWKWKNRVLCTAYAVPAQRLQTFDVRQEVWYADINWDLWVEAAAAGRIRYTEVPKFPAVQRDLALVLDRTVSYQEVQKATAQLKIDSLRGFDLFDVFESEKLGQNKKSYALSYTFQLQDRTLTDAEIEQLMQQLMGAYKTKLNAEIRS